MNRRVLFEGIKKQREKEESGEDGRKSPPSAAKVLQPRRLTRPRGGRGAVCHGGDQEAGVGWRLVHHFPIIPVMGARTCAGTCPPGGSECGVGCGEGPQGKACPAGEPAAAGQVPNPRRGSREDRSHSRPPDQSQGRTLGPLWLLDPNGCMMGHLKAHLVSLVCDGCFYTWKSQCHSCVHAVPLPGMPVLPYR